MTRPKKNKELTALDRMKLEIARDLGLEEKILALGWAELTAEESGRIGGILSGRRRAKNKPAGEDKDAVRGAGAQLRSMDETGSAH